MLLYCSKCNNLVDKILDEIHSQGSSIERKCTKCGTISRYYIQYKAVIDKKWHKLPSNEKSAIMVEQ